MNPNNNTTTQSFPLHQFVLENLRRLRALEESFQARNNTTYRKLSLKDCKVNELDINEKKALFRKIVTIWREFDDLKQQDVPLNIMKWGAIQEEMQKDVMRLAAPYFRFIPELHINLNKKDSACHRHHIELVYALFSIERTFEPMLNDSTSKKNLDLRFFHLFYVRTVDAYMQCLSNYKERIPDKSIPFIWNIQDIDRDRIVQFIQYPINRDQSMQLIQYFKHKYQIVDIECFVRFIKRLKDRYHITQHLFATLDEMIISFNKLCQKVEQSSPWICLPPRLPSFVEMDILDAHFYPSLLTRKSKDIFDELGACPIIELARLFCLIDDFQAILTNKADANDKITLYSKITQSIAQLQTKCSKQLIYKKTLVEQANSLIIKFNQLLAPEEQLSLIFLFQKDCIENTQHNRFSFS